jgi:hypothetical protein
VSGQLCRVNEGLSYKDVTLAHRHPPPSPQKSDTCILFKKLGAPRLSFRVCVAKETKPIEIELYVKFPTTAGIFEAEAAR